MNCRVHKQTDKQTRIKTELPPKVGSSHIIGVGKAGRFGDGY